MAACMCIAPHPNCACRRGVYQNWYHQPTIVTSPVVIPPTLVSDKPLDSWFEELIEKAVEKALDKRSKSVVS